MKQIAITDRIIEIPPEVLSYIGVAGDINSTIITFKMQRYADGVDFSTKTIKIAFENAAGETDYNDASDIQVLDDEYITFNWVLSGEVMATAGTIRAAIEISSTNEYDEKDYIWQTRPTSFTIVESIGEIENNANDSDHYYQILFYDNNDNESVYAIKDDGKAIPITGREIMMDELEKKDVAVSKDSNSQILTFTLPRFYQNVDLSQKIASVKFKNAKGESDRSKVINVVTEEELLHFGWLLDGNVTVEPGIVHFAIEFLGYNEYEEFYCWGTKPAQFTVVEGLDVDEDIDPPGPSWLQGWWIEMDTAMRTAEEYAKIAQDGAQITADAVKEAEGYANTAKTNAESTAADRSAVAQDRKATEDANASAMTAATNASNSAKAAATSETNAKNSATTASTAATTATNASNTATTAAQQAENAKTVASTAATNAQNSASAAKTSEQNAAKSLSSVQTAQKSVEDTADIVQTIGDAVKAGKSPIIGDNGNWYIWNVDQYVDSGSPATGPAGKDGDGHSPYIGDNGNWYTWGTDKFVDTGVKAQGEDGVIGKDGADGQDGKSAYQYAVDGGYSGTETEFTDTLAQAMFMPRVFITTLTASAWTADGDLFRQQITPPTEVSFSNSDRADFDADTATILLLEGSIAPENKDGVLYAVTTTAPEMDISIQVSLTRVKKI